MLPQAVRCRAIEFTDDERALVLRELSELRVSRAAFDGDLGTDRVAFARMHVKEIDERGRRLGGELDAVIFGVTFEVSHDCIGSERPNESGVGLDRRSP